MKEHKPFKRKKSRPARAESKITVLAEKLIQGGQALARSDGKICLLWNALPGETVEAMVLEEKASYLQATACTILTPSADRVVAHESHFLSCSPWQILSWEAENRWKCEIARESFERARLPSLPAPIEIIAENQAPSGYRNKIEYHFSEVGAVDGSRKLSLAVSGRRSHEWIPIDTCALAQPPLNETAVAFRQALEEAQIPVQILDRLVVKTNGRGDTLAALFVRKPVTLDLTGRLPAHCRGWHLFQAGYSSLALSPTRLSGDGDDFLSYTVCGKTLSAGIHSFFQIHLPLFELALNEIRLFLDPQKTVIDYYAGTGAISLALADSLKEAVLVESHPEAAHFALKNIEDNHLAGRCSVLRQPAAAAAGLLTKEHFVILDPPRAGLEPELISALLSAKPERILYLSCDVATQARDLARLSTAYTPRCLKLYNFFPRTPHFEALCVLDRS